VVLGLELLVLVFAVLDISLESIGDIKGGLLLVLELLLGGNELFFHIFA
jgi:hypothetical protein